MLRKYLSLMLCMICLSLLGTASANAQDTSNPVPDPFEVENGLQRDAEAYANDFGVSIEEAIERLELQPVIGQLRAELVASEPDYFAGLWIQHMPEFQVVVRFTEDADNRINPYLETFESLRPVVETQSAELALSSLRDIQASIYTTVLELDLPVETGIDIQNGIVELYATERAHIDFLTQALVLPIPDYVKTVLVPELSTPEADIYGGLKITESGSTAYCTSGFAVEDIVYGKRGVLTSGHCPNNMTYAGQSLPYEGGTDSGIYDVQWHSAPNFTVRNLIRTTSSGSTRAITDVESTPLQSVGDYVCKYGVKTHYTCGSIIDTSYNYNGVSSFIRVSSSSGTDLSDNGDSGGPWFNSHTAYGVHTDGLGNDAIYMAVGYAESLFNVLVMTN